MSRAVLLWSRLAVCSALAIACVVLVPVPGPAAGLPTLVALVLGVLAGGALVVVGQHRRLRAATRRPGVAFGVLLVLGVWAATEEIVWRRLALGELLRFGTPTALAASTLGFSLTHPARRWLHLGTGATFGGLYLGTGALAACIAAHWVYNTIVYLAVETEGAR